MTCSLCLADFNFSGRKSTSNAFDAPLPKRLQHVHNNKMLLILHEITFCGPARGPYRFPRPWAFAAPAPLSAGLDPRCRLQCLWKHCADVGGVNIDSLHRINHIMHAFTSCVRCAKARSLRSHIFFKIKIDRPHSIHRSFLSLCILYTVYCI